MALLGRRVNADARPRRQGASLSMRRIQFSNSRSFPPEQTFFGEVPTKCSVGLVVADFDLNGVKDLIFPVMEYHTGPGGAYKI